MERFKMIEVPFNSSIICVDDEEGILQAYSDVLGGNSDSSEQITDSLSRRRARTGEQLSCNDLADKKISYNIFLARSGEEAIKIVNSELQAGRQIAAGFFDMLMPGGMDGAKTIKRIHELDDQILCAVVTAYTDRSPEQLSSLFKRQDDWLFLNKPFSNGELYQTAFHLVTAWNQRRREEVLVSNLEIMQNGLFSIIKSVSDMSKIPPMMVENLLKGILNHFLNLVGSKNGFVIFLTKKTNIQFGAGTFEGFTDFSDLTKQPQWELASKVMQEKRSIIVKNMAATPLIIESKVEGVLFVQNEKDIIAQDSKLIDIYAIQAINMIHQSTLYKELEDRNLELNQKNQEIIDIISKLTKAENLKTQFENLCYLDSLISIPNRRYFEQRFKEEMNRSYRHKFSISCLMIDIDYFKQINDLHGHHTGDYVLKEIGQIFTKTKRTYDIVCRYGGEEFAVMLNQISREDTIMVAERMRAAVEKHIFTFEGKTIKVTISVGAVTKIPSFTDTTERMLQEADDALYRAKKEGRDRCVFV